MPTPRAPRIKHIQRKYFLLTCVRISEKYVGESACAFSIQFFNELGLISNRHPREDLPICSVPIPHFQYPLGYRHYVIGNPWRYCLHYRPNC